MKSTGRIVLGLVTALITLVAYGPLGLAQFNKLRPKPTEADWAALAKLPDFTGVWEAGGGGGGRGAGARGDAGARGERGAPGNTGDRGDRGAAGRGDAAGRGGRGRGGPSYTPEYLTKARPNIGDELSARCVPPGMPSSMDQPYPIEFLMTPGKVTMIIEAYQQVRHIYTDGRPMPDDPEERFQGTSIGHWDGDTLVVETAGFSPNTYLPGGVPHSDKMKIVERMRLTGPETMTIETTVTDPEALAAPIMSTRTLQRHRTWTIAEYVCEENNRNTVDETGKATTILGNPGGLPPKQD